MQQDSCGVSAAASLRREKQKDETAGSVGSSPAADDDITSSMDLAHVVARYIRRRCGRAHAPAMHDDRKSDLHRTSASLRPSSDDVGKGNGAEEAGVIAMSERVEAQLLQCLMHVRLNPNEVPRQPELPGDVGVAAYGTEEAEATTLKPRASTGGAGASTPPSPAAKQAKEEEACNVDVNVRGKKRTEEEIPAGGERAITTRPSNTAHSPPPRPPTSPTHMGGKHSAAAKGDTDDQQQQQQQQHARDRRKGTRASSSPTELSASPPLPPSSASLSPGGTKARDPFYAYTHSSMLPPRAPSQRPTQTPTRLPGGMRSGSAPAPQDPSSPSATAAAAAAGPVAAHRKKNHRSEEHAERGQRSSPPEEEKKRRRRSAGDRHRPRADAFEDGAAAAAEAANATPPKTEDELVTGVDTAAGKAELIRASPPRPPRCRNGDIRPLMPAEVAAAVASWPSRVVQYTLATKVAKAALSDCLVDNKSTVETEVSAGESEGNHHELTGDEAKVTSASTPPRDEAEEALLEGNTELKDLLQRIRDVLQYTNLAEQCSGTAAAAADAVVPPVRFPSFARFYLADPSLSATLNNSNSKDGEGALCDAVVQNFLAQLTDALVSAAVVPDRAEEEGDNDDGHPDNAHAVSTKEADAPLMFTGDIAKDIGLLLKQTPTILAASASSSLSPPREDSLDKSKHHDAFQRSARSVVRRSLCQLLRLAPSWHNSTMCTTPLVVGVLRRYTPRNVNGYGDALNDAKEPRDGSGRGLRIRLIPAAEVTTSSAKKYAATATAASVRQNGSHQKGCSDDSTTTPTTNFNVATYQPGNPTPMFYNALLIEVTGDDVTYASERDNAEADALPLEDEEDAKTIFHADVPASHRRQQRRSSRESSLGRENQRQDADADSGRPCLSRQQCIAWRQLLSLTQFIHVAGTPAQVETTARYVSLAIRHRREARNARQYAHQRPKQHSFLSSSGPFRNSTAAAAAARAQPSVAESVLPISVPAFFFTLTQTSALLTAEAATTRTLQYDEDDVEDVANGSQARPFDAHQRHEGISPDTDEDGGRERRTKDAQAREAPGERDRGSSSSASFSAQPSTAPRQGLLSSGLGLRALLGWRAASAVPPPQPPAAAAAAATTTTAAWSPPPMTGSPPRKMRAPSPSLPLPRAAAVGASLDDLVMRWMHDTLIPVFYETTVTCSEAGEVDTAGTASTPQPSSSSGGATTTSMQAKSTSDTNHSSGSNRRHRYRLRRQRALLGRVQAITAAMVSRESDGAITGNDSADVASSDLSAAGRSARVIRVDDGAAVIAEEQLVSYLLLNQLFFDPAAPAPSEAVGVAPDEATATAAGAAPRSGPRRARSAPSPGPDANSLHPAETQPPSSQHSPLRQQRRALSATPHRSSFSALQQQQQQPSQKQRRVSFREDAAGDAPQQLAPLLEAPVTGQPHRSGTADNPSSEASPTTTAVAAAATAAVCFSPLSPSPRSILKSGHRYKAEKLVRSSAPAASVVPFRSFALWRWLTAEVLAPLTTTAQARAAAPAEQELPDEANTRPLRAADLSPTLHLSSASYFAEAQTLAVRVACDVAVALLLAGLQAEQYACYRQLQHTCQIDKTTNNDDKTSVAADANTNGGDTSGVNDRLDSSPSGVDVLEARHTTAFQCDDILLLAKGVAEAVVRAALAPVVLVGVPPQLQRVVHAEAEPSDDEHGGFDDDDESGSGAASIGSRKGELKREDGQALSVASPAISALSPTLPPDVFQRFQLLSAISLYRVQRETLEGVTRPLDLALRRLTWCLAQHRLRLLCRPLFQLWKAGKLLVLSDIAAAAGTSSPLSSASLSRNAAEVPALLRKCVEAEHGLCVLVGQVLQLYEECFVLPHLLTGAGAPHAVELSLGEDEEGLEEGSGSLQPHVIQNSSINNSGVRVLEPFSPAPSSLEKDHPTAEGAASAGQQQQQQQFQRRLNTFVPLCFDEAQLPQKESMATFATPMETSLHPQQSNGSCLALLSAWNPAALDADNSFDLHSSVLCDLRPMRLSGGSGAAATAAAVNDFAAAVAAASPTAASPVRMQPSSTLRIGGRFLPYYASDLSHVTDTTAATTAATTSTTAATITTAATANTATTASTSGVLMSKSNLFPVEPPPQGDGNRDGGGEKVKAANPSAVTIDVAPSGSVSLTSPPNLLHSITGATTPSSRLPDKAGGGALHVSDVVDGPLTPFTTADGGGDGSAMRPRVSPRWLKLVPYQEQQQQMSDSRGMTSPSSFLTFDAVTPAQQRFHLSVFGASTREERTTPATGKTRGAREEELAPRDVPPQTTQPPTPVAPSDQPIPTEGAAAAAEENGAQRGAAAAADPVLTAQRMPSSPSSSSPHFAAQLRMGNVVESRLLSPFVEEAKRALVGALLQGWVLPRWSLLSQRAVQAVRQAERVVNDAPSEMPQQRQGTFSSTQTAMPLRPPARYDQRGTDTPKPSFDATARPDGNEEAGSAPSTNAGDAASALTTSLPPLSPPESPPPPFVTVSRENDAADVEHRWEEYAVPPEGVSRFQGVLDDITQACRDLAAAATQYELALVLEEPAPPVSTAATTEGAKQPMFSTPTEVAPSSVAPRQSSASPSATSSPPTSLSPTPPPPLPSASYDFLNQARAEQARIVERCHYLSRLLAGAERDAAAAAAEEPQGGTEESFSPHPFDSTQRGGENGGGSDGEGVKHHDSPLQDRAFALRSLSQGMRGPPCPTPSETSVVALGDQPQQPHRNGSFLGSVGPSQLFNPLYEPVRRTSTAYTLLSVPMPLLGTRSSTLISTSSSGEDDDAGAFTSQALGAGPAVTAFSSSQLARDAPQRRPSSSLSAGEVLPRLVTPTSVYPDPAASSVKEAEVSPTTATEVATSHGTPNTANATTVHPLPPQQQRSSVKDSESHRAEREAGEGDDEEGERESDGGPSIAELCNTKVGAEASATLKQTELPVKTSTANVQTITRHDCAQQTLPERRPTCGDASTQTPTPVPIEERTDANDDNRQSPSEERCGTARSRDSVGGSGSDGERQPSRDGKNHSAGSQCSVETAEVTPYKHRHRHRIRGKAADEPRIVNEVTDDSSSSDDDDDSSSSSLSPVSEHSSNRASNAIVSGRSSPMPSVTSSSSAGSPAASRTVNAPPQPASAAGDETHEAADNTPDRHRDDDADERVGGQQRPASPPPAPHVARCISLTTQSPSPTRDAMKDAAFKQNGDEGEGNDGDNDDDVESSADDESEHVGAPLPVDTTVVGCEEEGGSNANTCGLKLVDDAAPLPPPASTATETTPRSTRPRTPRPAATASPSTSASPAASSPWREHTPTRGSEAAVTALADLQQRLGGSSSTVAELRRQLDTAEAAARAQAQGMARLQHKLKTTEAALQRAVASQEVELERLQLHPPPPLTPARYSVAVSTVDTTALRALTQQPQQHTLLSPTVPSTPLKADVEATPHGRDGAAQPDEMEAAVSTTTAAAASQTTPHDTEFLTTATTTSSSLALAERRVRELEADMRNANFRVEQWKALLAAERHARAVQVDQLSQQLDGEQRRLQRRHGRSTSRSRSRSLSPVGSAEPLAAGPRPSSHDAEGPHPGNASVVGQTDDSDGKKKSEAEEQRLTSALQQQAEELKEREEGLRRHITDVLSRLHAAEARVEEQQEQSKRAAAAVAAAREEECAKLARRVSELESALEASPLRNSKTHLNINSSSSSSNGHYSTKVKVDDVGVQTDAVLAAPPDNGAARAVELREQAEKEAEFLAAQQYLQKELLEEQQRGVDSEALHVIEVAALRRDLKSKTRDAQSSRDSWMTEEAAHGRTRMTLEAAQAAVIAAQVARQVEEPRFQRDTAAWWTVFAKLGTALCHEKALLLQRVYAERVHLQDGRLDDAVASAKAAATAQKAAVDALQTALAVTREGATVREDDLQRRLAAAEREAAAMAATHAAATALRQHHAAQDTHVRDSTTAWCAGWATVTAQWIDAKLLLFRDSYHDVLQAREKEQHELVAGLQGTISTHASAIESLQDALASAHHDAEELKKSVQTHANAHARAVAEVERGDAAHVAAQAAMNTATNCFLHHAAAWWTSRASCLADRAEATTAFLEKTYVSLLRGDNAKQQAAVASRHEAALETLRQHLSDAQQGQQESMQRLQKEEEAHTRTVDALHATQKASAVARNAESAQQGRMQRGTAAWWAARESCVADWMEAKYNLVQDAFVMQQRQLFKDVVASAAVASVKPIVKAKSTQTSGARAADGAGAVDSRDEEKSPKKANEDDESSPRRSRTPDVVMMSLEDPLGLHYELQRKTRRIRSLEEKVRQLEAAHVADRQALTTLQTLLRHERGDHASPLLAGAPTSLTGGGGASPLFSPNGHAWQPPRPPVFASAASTPSQAPLRSWGEGGSNEMSQRTPSRSPGAAKSLRLTPGEYGQRFAGM
ncbi:hypothetical protein ABB37_07159 [Leptomonas pyrrhocoris]|uniref:Uncharacterized protein n=1 Tax=Leptomonas pyrrhocoris TaxID=157538 RepID=A0A0N0DTC5_LEPPY|nr:hypothetical protein ABB37_07159 [Leptomonas pyrrhocoris]KPA77264.1 hypothetical protein ABB37_07159 [Leptomonas pyrrhocoris]|eukprot:XP_015655703.1 hypothetical protein ABB37_07159 [Leptomonas pyrrhocoris]